MRVEPISLSTANTFVRLHHRHASPTQGHLFSLGLFGDDFELHGVAIIGRPVNRHMDDGDTVEITRLATLGARNACSQLYGAACREARRRGYRTAITYTRADETGASARAANFIAVATVTPRQWDCPSRPRPARVPVARVRWARPLRR